MKRQAFLRLLGWGLLASQLPLQSLAQPPEAAQDTEAEEQILIIGAGLAGLTAAQVLQQAGYQVQVLEARKRLGGRIWTSRHWPDAPLDLGASWIHGVKGNPLTPLAAEVGARTVLTSYGRYAIYGTDGKPLSPRQEQELETLSESLENALQAFRKQPHLLPDQPLQSAVEKAFNWPHLSAEKRQLLEFLLNGSIEQEAGGSSRELSARWYKDTLSFPGDDALFPQGFDQVIRYLARNIKVTLGQQVSQINWSGQRVEVSTQQRQYSADRVIVTLPLGVLKSGKLRFEPALPPAKQKAIGALGMGLLNKCYLRFAKAFWPAEIDWLEYIPSQRGAWTEWVSYQRAAGLPVLMGLHAAERGKEIENLSDRQLVASAMQTLRRIFGSKTPEPLDAQITRWASDPFALGAYSFNALGATPEMRDQLAAQLNETLFFAGEATERQHFSTAHGAYLSGLRVAEEIMDCD